MNRNVVDSCAPSRVLEVVELLQLLLTDFEDEQIT